MSITARMSSERYTFRVKSIAVLITFDDFIVPQDKYQSYLIKNDISIGSYTIEKHRDGKDHTHIVLVSAEPMVYECDTFHGEFGKYPHLKRLRSTDDAYKAIAYCSKQKTAQLMVSKPFSETATKEYILGHIWTYALRARTARTRGPLMAQYKRMQDEWFPTGPPSNPYNSSNVVSEDASKFFQ